MNNNPGIDELEAVLRKLEEAEKEFQEKLKEARIDQLSKKEESVQEAH